VPVLLGAVLCVKDWREVPPVIHYAHSWDDQTACGQSVLAGVTISTDQSLATCPACAASDGAVLAPLAPR
jgi:hypothetical protein